MSSGGYERTRRTVAIVADADADARAELAELLARIGCEPVQVATGKAALAAAEHELPVLVVLDVALNDVSAYECCRTLRERYGEALPIVLV